MGTNGCTVEVPREVVDKVVDAMRSAIFDYLLRTVTIQCDSQW